MKIIKEVESFDTFAENVWGKVIDAEEFIDDSVERFEVLEDIIAESLDFFSDYDTLKDENEKMAKFIESQGFKVDNIL